MAEAARAPRLPRRAPRLLLGIAALALVALWVLTALAMSGPPRNSAYLEEERGLSQLAAELGAQGIAAQSLASGPHALDAVEDPARTVFLVAGVERSYTGGEVKAIQSFVERGGRAVVADDFGFGDPVGEPFGVTFDKRVLRDASFHVNVSLVNVNATLAGRNYTLIMNVPASLGRAPGAALQPRAESGSDSYIDENLDGVEDTGDLKGPFLVIAEATRGNGTALFTSDPGMFANGLLKDNGPYLTALFRDLLPDGGTVVFDESRHAQGAGGAMLAALLAGEVQATSEAPLAVITATASLALAGAFYLAFEKPPDLTASASRLRERAHPGGDELTLGRLRRLARRAAGDAGRLSYEQVEEARPEELAALVPDPLLQALLVGQPTKEGPQELLRRLEAFRARRAGGRP
jgi:hypothetical protein